MAINIAPKSLDTELMDYVSVTGVTSEYLVLDGQ